MARGGISELCGGELMPAAPGAGRLEAFFELVSDCTRFQEYDPIFHLLAQRIHGLFEFERFSILLCEENRQILKTIVIEDCISREVPPDEIPLTEMGLILQTLVTGESSSGAVGICVPMLSGGRMIGLLCLAPSCEQCSSPDVRLLQFLAVILAGTFERVAQCSLIVNADKHVMPSGDGDETTTAKTHAVSLRMSYLAQHDALTDLPNRWLLNERLTRALSLSSRHHRRLAVLFLDIDRFKQINDSLGHAIGDQVLRQTSARLVGCVRASDTVSRIGGDEFVILLAELENEKDASICAGKILAAVRAPLKIASHEIHLTLSIGIGIYPGDGDDAEALICSADTAMYHAKAEGRGKCHFFRKDMNVVAYEQGLRV